MKLLLLVTVGCSLLIVETVSVAYQKPRFKRKAAQVEVTRQIPVGGWDQAQADLTTIDASILPDYWEPRTAMLFQVDPRVPTNGAEPPEQLVKVTDRKHKFPIFATICSISFLATVITLLIVCTN
ncbi:hypothetical protein PRIC1_001221 [Phytophthora ramorum]|uniref:uncharacterized protein n=1 Tax=Phytophthora ramorum TaxID=164328 RepID=UPI0030A08590|nr:hypothetical protein KRP23_7876 [Phytophthora ramorum]